MGTKEGCKTLKDLQKGERGKVVRIAAPGPLRRRLMDMGVVPGAEIKVEGTAPLGDPIEVTVKGYHLTLRREEAQFIEVEPC